MGLVRLGSDGISIDGRSLKEGFMGNLLFKKPLNIVLIIVFLVSGFVLFQNCSGGGDKESISQPKTTEPGDDDTISSVLIGMVKKQCDGSKFEEKTHGISFFQKKLQDKGIKILSQCKSYVEVSCLACGCLQPGSPYYYYKVSLLKEQMKEQKDTIKDLGFEILQDQDQDQDNEHCHKDFHEDLSAFADFKIHSIEHFNIYAGENFDSTLNSPKDLRIQVGLGKVKEAGKTYKGYLRLSYKDYPLTSDGVLGSELEDVEHDFHTGGLGLSDIHSEESSARYNYWHTDKKTGKEVIKVFFQHTAGPIILIIDEVKSISSGEKTKTVGAGSIWFKNFPNFPSLNSSTACWLVYSGLSDCRPWKNEKHLM